MITIRAEQEHYCLVTDGRSWTVIERRAGKYHPLGNCSQPGVALDEQCDLVQVHFGGVLDILRVNVGLERGD